MRQMRVWTILVAGVAYVVVGIGTALLAGAASSPTGVQAWRLAAWLLSLAVFGVHLAIERGRHEHRPGAARHIASQVALAVALGALGVAALGPMRSHWREPHMVRLALLSLVAWPVLTGVPAFAVAWMLVLILDRLGVRTRASRSRAG
ncbi:MAG TPA: hypothetical protein VLN49_11270 [Gemmatimonadaceae bacterium]|nr:hypothetical protein [Gemmatimonadaceae bacterium]